MHYNLNSNHLFAQDDEVIKKIFNSTKYKSDKLFREFVVKLFWHTPMKDFSELEISCCAKIAQNAYDFFKLFPSDESKIEIYEEQDLHNGYVYQVLQILGTEKPFVVDSIVCYLNKLGVRILKMIHPSIHVNRNDKSEFVTVDDNGSKEAVIILQLADFDMNLVDEAILNIRQILKQVNFAVRDWKAMISKANDFISYYKNETHSPQEQQRQHEITEFMGCIVNSYFVHLGLAEFNVNNDQINNLGIMSDDKKLSDILLKTVTKIENKNDESKFLEIGKLDYHSRVHRDSKLDYIAVRYYKNDKLEKIVIFVGLFTSILYYQSATLIPIIRKKMSYVLDKAGFSSASHSGKELVSIVECLPRDELFQIANDDLYLIVMEAYALMLRPEVKIFVLESNNKKFANCIIFMPHDRLETNVKEKISAVMQEYLGKVTSINSSNILHSKIYYYHVVVNLDNLESSKIDCVFLENKIDQVTALWHKKLRTTLFAHYPRNIAYTNYMKYKDAFPQSYKERHETDETVINDLKFIDQSMEDKKSIFKVVNLSTESESSIELKIYADHELLLSEVIPILHNIGFAALAEYIYKIKLEDKTSWVHHFYLSSRDTKHLTSAAEIQNIELALSEIWEEKVINDCYNRLILSSGLSCREVSLLRSVGKYLYQIKFGYSREFISEVLYKHPNITNILVDLFKAKFDFNLDNAKREKLVNSFIATKQKLMQQVNDPAEDKALMKCFEIIENTVRTNYYCKNSNGELKDYISLKINPANISNFPKPIPFREVFVSSAKFEAIHIRSTNVSRGGLRWSDRAEDFRTEVLGLVRAQIPKNSIIVPGGSKGGFYVKRPEGCTNQEYYNLGVESYKNFLRGLLDVTDNIKNGEIVHPQNQVIYDTEDPYLVVAADKGTATFSDIANGIADEYKFWLGDAFASGGSVGYDHKKMGITAKGAWISVMRHFKEMGVNTQTTDFTVVGIGDMSGDVFGNGMLLSKHIRLLAAFNHLHIFIDPNPDSAISYKERERMFNLPSSTWQDYNKSLISKGGMVYDRKAKIITLTPEIMTLFDINTPDISPDDFIKSILKSNYDLLWNGGIGTYIKAETEDHSMVGDKSNDALRINGAELGAKVLGEGGNLGVTQAGRIEFAKAGGKINTDSIDNSAGVNCSDHEVNIKIALEDAVRSGLITYTDRNKFLEEMTDEVAKLVLRDNILQTLNLSIALHQKSKLLSSQDRLIDILEKEGRLNRVFEKLPSKQEFISKSIAQQSLTRPELAVILSYSKLSIYDNLLHTSLVKEEYFEKDLLAYFPENMSKTYRNQILNHQLRKEIIATILSNDIVNRLGASFVHNMAMDYDLKICDIIRAYIIAKTIFSIDDIWQELEENKNEYSNEVLLDMYVDIQQLLIFSINWIVRQSPSKIDIAEMIEKYEAGVKSVQTSIKNNLHGLAEKSFEDIKNSYLSKGVKENFANKIAMMMPLTSALNIVQIGNKSSLSQSLISKFYFRIGEIFQLDWLRSCAADITSENNWQRLSLLALTEELSDIQRDITLSVLNHDHTDLESWLTEHEKYVERYSSFINEIKLYDRLDYSMIDIALKRLKIFLVDYS
jgi:glutamate dehydrogenase